MDRSLRDLVEAKIRELSRQMEMVLKTSRDAAQQKRVSVEIAKLRKDFKRLEDGTFTDADANRYLGDPSLRLEPSTDGPDDRLGGYPLLASVVTEAASPYCREPEANEIHSFLRHFESEYWGVISDFSFKLDFNSAQKRDAFYNDLNTIQIAFKKYLDVLHDLADDKAPREYAEKLGQMKAKLYRDLLLKVGDFLKRLGTFVDGLLDDYRNGGNSILNPDDELHFDAIHGARELEGVRIIDGVERLAAFLHEFIAFLNIPEIRKIVQEP